MYSNFLNENVRGEKKICSKLPPKSRGKIMSIRNRKTGENALLTALYWRFSLVLPYHSLNISLPSYFGFLFIQTTTFLGFFLFIPCCGFFNPEIMQDSKSPVLRLSGKTTVYIYDKNITNKIHKKCHGCHISDPGGYPLWIPTWEWNDQPGELKFQGYF